MWRDLVVVVHGLHGGLPDPLHHQAVAEGDGEDRQQVGSNELVEDESSFMHFRGKSLHAVLSRAIPVSFLYTLVH